MLAGAVAVRFKGMSIECARKRVAPRAREQIFIPLAVSQRVEYIPYPRGVLVPPDGPLEIDKVDAGKNRVEPHRTHFGDPAAYEHVQSRAREHVQTGEESGLGEAQNDPAAQRQSRKYAIAKPAPRSLVQQDHDDAVEEQDRR